MTYYIEGLGFLPGEAPTSAIDQTAPADTAAPSTAPWDYAQSQNTGFIYTPQQLGWDSAAAKRFSDAGITQLPGWFSKEMVYSPAFHLGSHDPVQNYIDLYNTPYDQAANQWSGSSKAIQSLFGSTGLDATQLGDAGKEAYIRQAFGNLNNAKDSWWDRNGPWVTGLGGIASIAGGGLLAELGGLGAGATIGAEAGAGVPTTAADLTALGGGMSAYGAGGAGAAGSLGSLGLSSTIGGAELGGASSGILGFSNMTPTVGSSAISDSIAAGGAAGADVGMGSGTGFMSSLGLPASYSLTDLLGSGTGLSVLGNSVTSGGTGSGTGGGTNWLSSLFGGSSTGTGGTDWSGIVKALIGAGSAGVGAIAGANAQEDALKQAQKNYQPFLDLGVSNIGAYNAADPTGGAGQYINQLKNYGTNFKFDSTNPEYTFKVDEANRKNNMALSARGMYNSRAGLNLLDQSNRAITADEYNTQYNRGYQNIMDLFNTTSQLGKTDYNALLDKIKIGAGAAGAAGNTDTAIGKVQSDLYTGLGAMPMNYMILQQLLSGGK